jgi:hypothetical protein
MKIVTGLEDNDGVFKCRPCGETHPEETLLDALKRMAAEWYGTDWPQKERKMRVVPNYDPINQGGTTFLPAVFIGRRGFFIKTVWNTEKRQWEPA